MSDTDAPSLLFFHPLPEDLLSQPPLGSALQSFETSLLLLALDRFPHALLACANAWESAIKANLGIPPTDRSFNAERLIKEIRAAYKALESFDEEKLQRFRFMRNNITHFGFSPKDDSACAELILESGIPFFYSILERCFKFHLDWREFDPSATDFWSLLKLHEVGRIDLRRVGLHPEIADQIRSARDIYSAIDKRHLTSMTGYTQCFRGFSFFLRGKLKESHMTLVDDFTLEMADKRGMLWEMREAVKESLRKSFGEASWEFDCPVCGASGSLIAKLLEVNLERKEVAVEQCRCVSCGFFTRDDEPVTSSILMADTLKKEQPLIIQQFF